MREKDFWVGLLGAVTEYTRAAASHGSHPGTGTGGHPDGEIYLQQSWGKAGTVASLGSATRDARGKTCSTRPRELDAEAGRKPPRSEVRVWRQPSSAPVYFAHLRAVHFVCDFTVFTEKFPGTLTESACAILNYLLFNWAHTK